MNDNVSGRVGATESVWAPVEADIVCSTSPTRPVGEE